MPREYPSWGMGEEDRSRLGDKLRESLFGDLPDPAAIEDIVSQVGRDRLIEEMSGTTDRGSREWKNARDNLSRYRRGARHPSPAKRAQIRGASERRQRDTIRDRGRASVTLSATFHTSGDRAWKGVAKFDLTGPDLDDFLTAQAGGDDELAAQIFTDAYGLDPQFVISIEDIDGFDVE